MYGLALLATLAIAFAAEDISLLVSKELTNKFIVQGRDVVFKYAIYNIGASYVS